MNLLPIRFLAACAVAFAATGALAVHAATRDEQEHACRGDALRLCAADVPHKDRIAACMKQHYDQLSPGCQAMFDRPPPAGRASGERR